MRAVSYDRTGVSHHTHVGQAQLSAINECGPACAERPLPLVTARKKGRHGTLVLREFWSRPPSRLAVSKLLVENLHEKSNLQHRYPLYGLILPDSHGSAGLQLAFSERQDRGQDSRGQPDLLRCSGWRQDAADGIDVLYQH